MLPITIRKRTIGKSDIQQIQATVNEHWAKGDKKIIDKPRVLNISRANILAQMDAIVLLLTRAFSFVVKVTCQIRKILDTKGQLDPKDLVPYIPGSIIRLLQIQLE